MKIATAIKSALAAFPQQERRIALAQFIIRYATDSTTKITHYRCIGHDADVITAFLIALGFTDSDYTLVKSELDPDTCQIRWKKGSKRLSKFIESLYECVCTGVPCSEVYRCIVGGEPSRVFGGVPDPEDDAGHALTGGPHLSETIQDITDKILKWAEPCVSSIQYEVWTDCLNGGDRLSSNAVTSESRVHIPQISALERYAWAMDLLPNEIAKPVCPIFALGLRNMTAARYMGLTDNVKFTAGIYDAPANMMLIPQETTGDDYYQSPSLTGFLVDTAEQAYSNKLVKPDSDAVYVLTTGVVETVNTGENRLRIAEFVADSKKLWDYVTAIYESVYHGLVCTIMPHSHVGVNNNVEQAFPDNAYYPVDFRGNSNPFHVEEGVGPNLLVVCAGVVLARREVVERFVQTPKRLHDQLLPVGCECPAESFIRKPGGPGPEYIDIAPDKKDIPAMWFAATHLEPGAITPDRQCMVDAGQVRIPEVSLQEQAAGMQRFHDLVAQWDTSELSVVKAEESESSMEGPCFTAFVNGLVAAVFQELSLQEGLPHEALMATWSLDRSPGKGHSESLYVTNVYSGVVTDESPPLTESVYDEAEAFPYVYDTRYEFDEGFVSSELGLTETDLFTQFVARMADGTSAAQMTMALKSEGTHRSFILIAETNFNFAQLRRIWARGRVRAQVIRAFQQAFIVRNRQYAASTSLAHQLTKSPYYGQMSSTFSTVTGSTWANAMTVANVPYHSDEVTIRPDNYGRTYFVFRTSARNAMYAMAIFRFLAGMPVHTKWLARLLATSTRASSTLAPEEITAPTLETVHKYIRLVVHKKLAESGYSGESLASHDMSVQSKLYAWISAVSRSAGEAGIGRMAAPSRALLTRATIGSECNLPIITNFGAPCS